MISKLLLIGAGGFVGSILRFSAGGALQKLAGTSPFPLGTLGVNVAGCFLIGLVGGLAEGKAYLSEEIRMFLMVGLLGGFTTFSAFGYETLTLLRDQQVLGALASVGLHVVLGVGAVWLGYTLLSNLT